MKPKTLRRRKATEFMFVGLFILSIVLALGTLAVLLLTVVLSAIPYFRPEVLYNYAGTTDPYEAGYAAAIVSTLWIVGLTLLFSLPLGIAAGIYLEEYAPRSRVSRILQAGVGNLAGVPSVVFGLLGLALFVRLLYPITQGATVLSGALTLTILVFPYVVVTTQEAVRAVPASLREGSLALGATQWQTVQRQVVPAAAPGLLTATILAASRAIGETAPLIVIGMFFFQAFLPSGPLDPASPLPVQIYGYIGLPADPTLPSGGFPGVAAAGIVILLTILFGINAVAIIVRNRLQRQRW